jgi:hypothetical protein
LTAKIIKNIGLLNRPNHSKLEPENTGVDLRYSGSDVSGKDQACKN